MRARFILALSLLIMGAAPGRAQEDVRFSNQRFRLAEAFRQAIPGEKLKKFKDTALTADGHYQHVAHLEPIFSESGIMLKYGRMDYTRTWDEVLREVRVSMSRGHMDVYLLSAGSLRMQNFAIVIPKDGPGAVIDMAEWKQDVPGESAAARHARTVITPETMKQALTQARATVERHERDDERRKNQAAEEARLAERLEALRKALEAEKK